MQTDAKQQKKKITFLETAAICSLVIGFFAFFSGLWYCSAYGDVGFDSILFTLTNGTKGVGGGLIYDYLLRAALPAVLCSVAGVIFVLYREKLKWVMRLGKKGIPLFPIKRVTALALSLVTGVGLLLLAADFTGLGTYVNAVATEGSIYEKHYVSPEHVEILFPEKKQNLIYIFLESMENTYMSEEAGGGAAEDLIPELAQLARENISFSHKDGLGGFHSTTGTTWTTGALIGITAGIHLQVPTSIDPEEYDLYYDCFLPGAKGITDVLHEVGYRQTVMFGSDASFGGRREYFTQHGVDTIFDIFTARERGLVPEDYFQWWGFEDEKLFEYAKTELETLSQSSEPFALYLLTADTHFPDGYLCPDCPDTYEEQYENVIACSSKRVYAFVQWLLEQPFMENTTVVISGDHRTMDNTYISECVDDDYVRTQYNCFINAKAEPVSTQNRGMTPFDMFPSTLAAMGCTISGERLGLGTNLFSEKQTVLEKYGSLETLDLELAYYSEYYHEHFAATLPEERTTLP